MSEIIFKPTAISRSHKLVIENDYLELGMKYPVNEEAVRINSDEIEAFKHGVKWIRGYVFTIGRIYCIDIRSKTGKTISIRLKSLYRVNKNSLFEKYAEIIRELSECYFNPLLQSLAERIFTGGDWTLDKVIFRQEGVEFRKKKTFVRWTELTVSNFSSYCAIHSKSDPDIHEAFYYLDEWNSPIVYSFSKYIIEHS